MAAELKLLLFTKSVRELWWLPQKHESPYLECLICPFSGYCQPTWPGRGPTPYVNINGSYWGNQWRAQTF